MKAYLLSFLLVSVLAQECAWDYGIPGEHNKVTDENTRRNLIVDGQAATPHEYPWQVQLSMGCGGSIISKDWILTAAHCHPGGDGSTTVIAGLNRYRIPGQFISHEEYGVPFNLFNDIALVRLEESLPCDDPTVGAIALAEATDFSIDDCSAWVTGFGALSFGGFSPSGYEMHEVQTRVYTTETCNNADENIYNLPETQICGFTPGIGQTNNEDSCQGDSGGPFKIDISTSLGEHKYTQVGIVSYGSGCGTTAGIYTDVASYKDWILERVPTAHFIPVNECDKNHYEEGIVDCDGQDCSLELPYCQGDASTWEYTDPDNSFSYTCSTYNSFALNCFAHLANGYYAYEVCSSCDYCRAGTDTTPLVTPDQAAGGVCPGGQQVVNWELTTTSWAKEMGFQIGDNCAGSGFQDDSTYTGTCCLPDGNHDVTCTDRYGDGWHRGAELKVDGAQMCGTFETQELSTSLSVSSGSSTGTEAGVVAAAVLVPLFLCCACGFFICIYMYSWDKVQALCGSNQEDVESKMPLSPRVVVGGAPEAPKSYVGTDARRGSYWRNFQAGNQNNIGSAPPAPPTASNVEWYYVDKQNESQGPVSNAKFMSLLGTEVTEDTYVWNEKMTDWAYVRTLPALKSKLQNNKPSLPPHAGPPRFQRPQPTAYSAGNTGSSGGVANRIAMFNNRG